jgi:hypothetical protein
MKCEGTLDNYETREKQPITTGKFNGEESVSHISKFPDSLNICDFQHIR